MIGKMGSSICKMSVISASTLGKPYTYMSPVCYKGYFHHLLRLILHYTSSVSYFTKQLN